MVLMSTAWPRIRLRATEIRTLINETAPGDYREVQI